MLGSYSRQQPHIGAALMQLQPALLDSAPDAGTELRAACLERVEEGIIDFLDVDSAVLDWLYAGGELDQLAGCGLWIGKRAFGDVLHRWNQNLKPLLGLTCPRVDVRTVRRRRAVGRSNAAVSTVTGCYPSRSRGYASQP